jgi:hypothetical protein
MSAMADRTPLPLPPDPFAEVKARFGQENLEAVLETYRAFANKVDYRKLIGWTMKQPVEDLLQPLFLAALVVITKELDLGSVAAELEAARSASPEPPDVAESLAATVRDLQAHIEVRADEIAGPLITATQQRAAERIAETERDAAFEKQRHADLEHELRRQLDAQVKANERLHREVKETRAAVRRVEALKVWVNEDRKQFVFAGELWEALAECGSPAARAYGAFKAAADEGATK